MLQEIMTSTIAETESHTQIINETTLIGKKEITKIHKDGNRCLMRGPLYNQGGDMLNSYMNTIIHSINVTSIKLRNSIIEFFNNN